jgi:hypothetical protein
VDGSALASRRQVEKLSLADSKAFPAGVHQFRMSSITDSPITLITDVGATLSFFRGDVGASAEGQRRARERCAIMYAALYAKAVRALIALARYS